jgi:DNA recombination protein RmuC
MDIWVLILVTLLALLSGGVAGALLHARTTPNNAGLEDSLAARAEEQAVLRASMDRLHEQLRDADQQRASWQGQFQQQVEEMRHANVELRRETGALSTALRKPTNRGRWGEQHLRRTVELAGMTAHCDFSEQFTMDGEDGRLRPDLVVHLDGGRNIVVDSKVPLDAYLDVVSTEDPDELRDARERHVRQVRKHISDLSSKRYWAALDQTPEFVVLFVASESALSDALENDAQLLDYAGERNVILASPTTLIGLLRTIAHGWKSAVLAQNTREVHELGRQLHERLTKMGDHLDTLGRSLTSATAAYNKAIGSLESRVLVTARQFEEMAVTTAVLPSPKPVTEPARNLSAPELIAALTPNRDEIELEPASASRPDSADDCPSLGA